MVHLMIIDDEPLIFYTLQHIINNTPNMSVMHLAERGEQALDQLKEAQPDVILLDIQMPGMNGIECLKRIHETYPHIIVILLTTFDDDQYIIESLANGARSYLLKSPTFPNLISHINDAINDAFVMPSSIARKLALLLTRRHTTTHKYIDPAFLREHQITDTEHKILELLLQRLSTSEIAGELSLQVGTVRNRLVTIFGKLNVNSRLEALSVIERHVI